MSAPPLIAVVGRRNVGKSTLVNRLFGARHAIAHETPGVTRDRIQLETSWRGKRFGLVDTAGYLHGPVGVEAIAAGQTDRAAAEADLILLVVDVQAGITEEDAQLARRLRRAKAPVLLVANKVDTDGDEADAAAFHALGMGEPFAVSALHGRSAGDLLDRLVQLLPDAPVARDLPGEPRFAIIGRPNVGKSSLFNRIVGEERSVVFEEAGTTRDAVDALVEWPGTRVRFVDTAGMRRAVKVRHVEYYGLLRAARAIDRSDAAVLVVDASQGFTSEDKRIASRVMQAGRGIHVVANKWDLVDDKDAAFKGLTEIACQFALAAVARTSARTGQGIHRLPSTLLDLHRRWSFRAQTAKVNEIVQRAQAERPPPRSTGTIHYATQVSAGPPTFALFGGGEPDEGYLRFVENRLRAALGFEGVPIRLRFRGRGRGVG